MPTQDDYRKLVSQTRDALGNRTFMTVPRQWMTDMLREVSHEPKTRIRSLMAQQIETEFYKNGLATYPPLSDVTGQAMIRIFRTQSIVATLVEAITNPSEDNDAELRRVVRESNRVMKKEEKEPALAAST